MAALSRSSKHAHRPVPRRHAALAPWRTAYGEDAVPCWVGGMLESAVGVAHCIALATLPGFTYPADIFPSSRFYRHDLGEPDVALTGPSQVRALDQPERVLAGGPHRDGDSRH